MNKMYTILNKLDRIEDALHSNYRGILQNQSADRKGGLMKTMKVAFVSNDEGNDYLVANESQDRMIKKIQAGLEDESIDAARAMGNPNAMNAVYDKFSSEYDFKLHFHMGGVESYSIRSKQNRIWRSVYVADVKVPFLSSRERDEDDEYEPPAKKRK